MIDHAATDTPCRTAPTDPAALLQHDDAQAGLDEWGLFQDALADHPGELPALGGLEHGSLPSLNAAFDELVWFTLAGIARRRGEVLSTRLPAATAP